MNAKTARRILALRHPDAEADGAVARALEFARGDAALSAEVKEAGRIDRACGAAMKALAPDDTERAELRNALEQLAHAARHFRFSFSDPGVIALALALLLLLGFGVWHFATDNRVARSAETIRAVMTAGTDATAGDFESVEAQVGELDDWFVLNGVTGYRIPESFRRLETVAARVFTHGETPVACLAVPENRLLLFVFEARPVEVDLPEDGDWHFFAEGEHVGAVRQSGGMCFMVVSEGSETDLRDILGGIGDGG